MTGIPIPMPPSNAKEATGLATLPANSEVSLSVLTQPPGLGPGCVVGGFKIIGVLGCGGMGVVYLAENRLMGRTEVLKVMSSALARRLDASERFRREIRCTGRLHHPNIVQAYSVFRLGDSLVLALEHVDGIDLGKLVKSRGPLPIADACEYARQAAKGLQHAFEQGMIHRDITPANLVLVQVGKRHTIKILDLGLAKETRGNLADAGLTGEGQMLGTPDYVAPEQAKDAASADIRSDIYSLGGTLYHLLTGAVPFPADSVIQRLCRRLTDPPPSAATVRPEVGPGLDALIRRMMARDLAERPQTPAELIREITEVMHDGADR